MNEKEFTGYGLCACLGPIADDPFCPCVMKQKGLEVTNLWTPEKIAELDAALAKFCAANKASADGKNE